MRYLDTGAHDAAQALATWFQQVLSEDVSELRIQSGYFSFDAVRAISGLLKKSAASDLPTYVVLGSNDGDTLHSDVSRLSLKLGVPRPNARLVVIRFGNALFHPKCYHVTRGDGSQAAFVGSANFTGPGLTGSNVEAAIAVDTREGDSPQLLDSIKNAVDRWLGLGPSEGVFTVNSQADIDSLLELGVIAQTRPPRPSGTGAAVAGKPSAKRQKLVKLPPWPDDEEAGLPEEDEEDLGPGAAASTGVAEGEPTGSVAPPAQPTGAGQPPTVADADVLPSEKRSGFPEYVRFAPGATEPTQGWSGLSGVKLEHPNVGLILRLTKDSARHFKGGEGTANISIPVAVAHTFRFGVLPKSGRPRAEFGLRARYYSDNLVVERVADTNVMAYGYMPGESGHGDLRMLVPKAVKKIADEVTSEGEPLPAEGDLFLLEWPNSDTDSFGLTFLHPDSVPAKRATALYSEAKTTGALFGAACWLPPEVVPEWQ